MLSPTNDEKLSILHKKVPKNENYEARVDLLGDRYSIRSLYRFNTNDKKEI